MLTEKEMRVIDAAQNLFHRFGVRRVTMADIAQSLKMSRPALYLVFPNKEAIFESVVRVRGGENLERIRVDMDAQTTLQAKLVAAFERWSVVPYEIVQNSPEARDLIDQKHGLAQDAMAQILTEFEKILEQTLENAAWQRPLPDTPQAMACMLIAAAYGFKSHARDVDELRRMLACQIELASNFDSQLGSPKANMGSVNHAIDL